MPKLSQRRRLVRQYLFYMTCRNLFTPITNPTDRLCEVDLDIATLLAILRTRYIQPRLKIPKAGNLHLAFQYADIPSEEHRFIQMLRVTPRAFHHILALVQDHPIFTGRSNKPQAAVELQLAVMLFRAGRFGNGASIEDVARTAGISEGSVLNYTERCMEAILALEPQAMRKPTEEEREKERRWVEEQVGCPSFRNGWCTGDGTLVTLSQKPGLNGDAYYSRKMNYDLNVQIVNLFSNLRIIDYVAGFVGSAHDSTVFQHSAVSKHPTWLFGPDEFMWADSAYTLTPWVIPVHKRPAADEPLNRQFDSAVAHIRIRSEHCMGALKGRWQSLRGLRIPINRKRDHITACKWIRMCIILHNLVIDIEGEDWARYYWEQVPQEAGAMEDEDAEPHDVWAMADNKRRGLVLDYASFKDELRLLRGQT